MWIHVVIFVMILCALTGWKKGWIPSYGIGGKDGIRLFAVVAIAGNLLGMILTLQNGGQVYPQGYRLEKEDTGSYEKEFMVSVDGEEPVSMYIQVPEKELEEQEEEPKQNKKLTRKEQAQKSIAEAVSRYNEQRSDPDYYYLPDKLNGKNVKWESPADTSGMLLTGLFLIAAMAILYNHVKVHAWTGTEFSDNGGEQGETEPMVYVTASGSVYHKNPGCSYLNVSLKQIPGSSAKSASNKYGEHYSACEICSRNQNPAGVVYVTEQGNRYHHLESCSGLKRSVRLVKASSVSEMGACSRCG